MSGFLDEMARSSAARAAQARAGESFAALACRKCSSEPSKREGSVSTDTAAAPPCA